MNGDKAIEIINNAQNYSMIEIREAEQVIDEMVEKAESFDEIIELEPKSLKYIDRPHLLRNQIKDIIWQYESEND